jgi:hypothetical protein
LADILFAAVRKSDHGVFAQLMRDLEPHPLQSGVLLGTPRVVSNFLYFIDSRDASAGAVGALQSLPYVGAAPRTMAPAHR